jgi:arginase
MWSDAGNAFSERGLNLAGSDAVVDAGDVPLAEDDGDRARIEAAIEAQLDAGRPVLALGGDHSVTYPIVRAFARRFPTLSVVHFDAHPDLYESFRGNRFSHACPFARILEATGIRLMQIGIRTMTPPQQTIADRHGVRVFPPWELAAARAALPDGPVYVTLDLDGLDPAFAPGVSHREPGGLSVRDVLDTIVAIPGSVVGADVVELNPDKDVDGLTAAVAGKIAREFAARMLQDL